MSWSLGGPEEVDQQFVDSLRLIVLDPVRGLGQAHDTRSWKNSMYQDLASWRGSSRPKAHLGELGVSVPQVGHRSGDQSESVSSGGGRTDPGVPTTSSAVRRP